MKVIDQPRAGRLGDTLQELLDKRDINGFNSFYLMTAYVKSKGVIQLKQSMDYFKRRGGFIKAVVGIDQNNTSIQGLEQLLPLSNELYVYHNRNPVQTFHSKVYFFEKVDDRAVVFVGSNNFTFGGLYTNFETTLFYEYNLKKKDDLEEFLKIKNMFSLYTNVKDPFCKLLTPDLLKQLIGLGCLEDEEKSKSTSDLSPARTNIREPFGYGYITLPRNANTNGRTVSVEGNPVHKELAVSGTRLRRRLTKGRRRPHQIFYIINTNRRNGNEDDRDMINKQKAAAYFGKKNEIKSLHKGDKIFLYRNHEGIVARGIVSEEPIMTSWHGEVDNEECYVSIANEFQKLRPPLSASDIKKITGIGILSRTKIGLDRSSGEKLWEHISKNRI
jgi:HKD family nuclease